MTQMIYVDALNGSDENSGGSPDAALASLAAAKNALADGAQLFLHAGQQWNESLWIRQPNVTVSSYGEGADPLIDGGGVRHGVIVQAAGVTIDSIDVSHARIGVYVTDGGTASVHGGVYYGNGTGIVADWGAALTLVDGSICKNSTLRLGAGDGIQVSEDAAATLYTIRNVQCLDNDKQGLNFKMGDADVSGGTFEGNGETGIVGQVHAGHMNLTGNIIAHNNAGDRGTFNLGLENGVEVRSTNNVYADPTTGWLACSNINISGEANLYSVDDTFIESAALTNFVATIGTHTTSASSVLDVLNPTVEVDHSGGRFIDAYGAVSNVSVANADLTSCQYAEYRGPTGWTGHLDDAVGVTTSHSYWDGLLLV